MFALLRGVSLPGRLVAMLEGEAGLNDPVAVMLEGEAGLNNPVAVMLMLVMIEVIRRPSYAPLDAVWFLSHELVIGVLSGLLVGAAGTLGGSGFLAVYIARLVLAGSELPERPAMHAFHEGLAGVAEIGMFFTLGLLTFPSQLGHVLVRGTVLALVVAVLARPLAAYAATLGSRLRLSERGLLGWAGLRGGVPVVLATLPVIDHIPGSVEFFDLVFFAVLVSTLLQGATVELLAQRLKLSGTRR